MTVLEKYSVEDLQSVKGMPLLLEVALEGQRATHWAAEHAGQIDALLNDNGAVMLRGLNIMSSKQFGQVLSTLFDAELLNYSYRSTPRTELKGNVYTATEYHPDEVIPQHNEHAYSNKWAMRLGLCCLLPPQAGGETPIADSREVFKRIPQEIREKFAAKKVKYVRNYGDIDLPWSEVFQTTDKREVEQYCFNNQLDFEWIGEHRLRTSQVNPAIARHPKTDEQVWFNQAHLFHVSSLGEETCAQLLSACGEDGLPRNAFYGDGEPLEPEVLDIIRAAYDDTTLYTPWQKGDLMLVDNMLFTHGRRPFSGDRKVLVGMAREYGW
ncbi:hypothetical protein PRUB_a3224 [Pseudoalteromonas rubra]|uniref:TauD/TfdA-like domain-containing protein n=1 Tax=Pseudoalteromonas rubra TaxID=43658 RepID=A0A8T0C4C8_9GAMM|nr:TauD/TfdA family dioxygenase [Pseudoalteromonas rubra]KAF7783444.1 hypothetical protein PRUB_a3224 [Pseudoalteromonas rubra]